VKLPTPPVLIATIFALALAASPSSFGAAEAGAFPLPLEDYQDAPVADLGAKLWGRIVKDPFNLIATALFLCAIIHTFLVAKFRGISHRAEREFDALEAHESHPEHGDAAGRRRDALQFKMNFFHFLGEVEAVFGIWLVPLVIALVAWKGWGAMVAYLDGVHYTEPIFVVAVMAIAGSRPVLRFTETLLARVAALGRGTPAAWWLAILTVGPLLGSFITEPAAMTICALLLVERFYKLEPGMPLRYATLGLLFVNISVGGTLSHFAAPPVVMVAGKWDWGLDFMLMNFGWKAAIGIVAANAMAFGIFRRELLALEAPPAAEGPAERPIPRGITIVHLLFIAWTVLNAHHPALVVFGFLFFLAFVQATERNQEPIGLRGPLLVGFFLAALVIHGGGQQWWIAPVLTSLSKWPLMIGATVLTAFNDNAAITYLASLVPDFSAEMKYAVMAGAVTGGGLTVIANAPNPAGQSILGRHFGDEGIHPGLLLLGALGPTVIMGAAFMLL